MVLCTVRLASAIAGTALLLAAAGCAGNATAPRQMPNCSTPDVLVCYGKTASRLDKRDRLEDVEFCVCEPARL